MLCACCDPAAGWLAFGEDGPEIVPHEGSMTLTAICVAAVYGALLFAIYLGL
jgi:hypothetical protein